MYACMCKWMDDEMYLCRYVERRCHAFGNESLFLGAGGSVRSEKIIIWSGQANWEGSSSSTLM